MTAIASLLSRLFRRRDRSADHERIALAELHERFDWLIRYERQRHWQCDPAAVMVMCRGELR